MRFDIKPRRLILGLCAVALFVFPAAAMATFVNFHDVGGFAHGLADGDNNNGYVRDYVHADNGTNRWLVTQRWQDTNNLGFDQCGACPTIDRGISPTLNECHESVDTQAADVNGFSQMSNHRHYHANYCGS